MGINAGKLSAPIGSRGGRTCTQDYEARAVSSSACSYDIWWIIDYGHETGGHLQAVELAAGWFGKIVCMLDIWI